MTFEEAVQDKNRPLSIAPREWMTAVAASVAEEDELTEAVIERIAEESEENKSGVPIDISDPLVRLELGIDQIVQGIKVSYSALDSGRRADCKPDVRRVLNKVRDLFDNAISPYTIDIIDELQKLETEE